MSSNQFFADENAYSGDSIHIIKMYVNAIKESLDYEIMANTFTEPLYVYGFGSTCLVLTTNHQTVIKIGHINRLIINPYEIPEILLPKRKWFFSEYCAYEQDLLTNTQISREEYQEFVGKLREKGYSYFDNSNNILKDSSGQIKIIDYGSVYKISENNG